MFTPILLILHVCPCFSKSKESFAPTSQHCELVINNGQEKNVLEKEKGEKTILPLIQNIQLISRSPLFGRDPTRLSS
jgi:hypothetical protein